MTIGDIMTLEPYTISRWSTVGQALSFVEESGFQRLLVMDAGALVGVVCACRLWNVRRNDLLASHMTPHVIAVGRGLALEEAAHVMHAFEIGCLPVMAGRQLFGVVTRGDLMRAGVPTTETGPVCRNCGDYHHVRWLADGTPLCRNCGRGRK